MEDEKIMWFYKMGMINSLKGMNLTDNDLVEVYKRLYTSDTAVFYAPFKPIFYKGFLSLKN